MRYPAQMDTRARRILRQHVMTDRLLGIDAVPMGQLQPPTPLAAPQATATPRPAPSAPPGQAPLLRPTSSTPGQELSRDQKLAILQTLDTQEVKGCVKCTLCHGRTQTVFGEGDPDAKLMFIGEGPGQTEDEVGRPFVGRAGELLDKMIVAIGYQRQQVYIANVVKCRPPNNRPPQPDEIAACWDYLRRQILTINPKVIVTLGGPATKTLLDTKTGITALRGTWQTFTGLRPDGPDVPVMPTFHPAFLLRQYTVENRRKVWDDLKEAA
ncbi:MAG: uracil-DNA glycosylase, partial [Phycisphaeraceae bacterium]